MPVAHVFSLLAVATVPVALLWPRGYAAEAPPFDPASVPRVATLTALDDPELLLPRGPAPLCGAPVTIRAALVDPDDRPDRDGEVVVLTNLGATAVDLAGWRLAAGRRSLVLPPTTVEPGASVELTRDADAVYALRPLRLSNRGGSLVLRDPCGLVRARLTWGDGCPAARPGWWVEHRWLKRVGPARSV